MAIKKKLPVGAKEIGGRVYDTITPCDGCGHIKLNHPDGLGHCMYRTHGFDPKQVILCGDKWTDIQKRR